MFNFFLLEGKCQRESFLFVLRSIIPNKSNPNDHIFTYESQEAVTRQLKSSYWILIMEVIASK